jgi:hypothetical protein
MGCYPCGPQAKNPNLPTFARTPMLPTSLPNLITSLILWTLATASQTFPLFPPSVPVPTFFMDLFMLFSPSHGFVESSITSFVDFSLPRSASSSITLF